MRASKRRRTRSKRTERPRRARKSRLRGTARATRSTKQMAQAATTAGTIVARNLARVTQNQVLNNTLKKDIDYYKQGAEKLDDVPCDGTNLPIFLKMFQTKALPLN
jgi:hypothetical protein